MEKLISSEISQKINNSLIKQSKSEFKEVIENDFAFSPINFNNLTLKNHFCFKNLSDNMFLDEFNVPTSSYIKFYEKIAKSNVGIVISGPIQARIEEFSKQNKNVAYNQKKRAINVYSAVTSAMHMAGIKMFMNIQADYGRGNNKNKWFIFNYSASNNISYKNSNMPCIRITDGCCKKLIKSFVDLAELSKKANFDGIMVDGSMFNILGELSSKEFNRRSFGYYSNTEDFAVSLISNINKNVKDLNIIYSFTIDSLIKQAYDNKVRDIKSLAKIRLHNIKNNIYQFLNKLVSFGVDAFYFEFGTFETEFFKNFNQFQCENIYLELLDDIKSYFRKINLKNKFNQDVFVIGSDNYNSIKTINNIIKDKKYDACDITKNIYANINIINDYMAGNKSNLCLKCSYCNFDVCKNEKLSCTVNPYLTDFSNAMKANAINLKVAVIGSGTAGLSATKTLLERGFQVDLIEKSSTINKTGRLCELFGYDELLKNFNDNLESSLKPFIKKQQLNIQLKTEAKVENLLNEKYNSIVVATGFHERFLNITGAILKNVKSIYEVLENEKLIIEKQKVVIYARSELSLKFAIYLINNRKNISIILNSVDFLQNLSNDRFTYYMQIFSKHHVRIYAFSKIKRIEQDFVELIVNNKMNPMDFQIFMLNNKTKIKSKSFQPKAVIIDMDLFVYEPELYSNNKLYYELVAQGCTSKIYLIGNALEIKGLDNDIKTGYFVAKNL